MNIDQLAKALWEQQVIYYKKIRRYDQDYDQKYSEMSDDTRDGFKFFAAWILTHKQEIFPNESL